jgi:hypothetical protein
MSLRRRHLTRSSCKTLGNPTRKPGMSWELLRLQSLAHASGFQMLCNSGFETAANRVLQTLRHHRW